MRIAILETVKTTAGFEQEFDRLIFEELKNQGESPILYLPEKSSLSCDFGTPIEYLSGGEIINYEGAGLLKKWWLTCLREKRRIQWFNSAYEKAKNKEVDAILITTATYRYLRSLQKSKLRNSPVPVIFIFLGVNPEEKPKFLKQALACKDFKNIYLKITSLRNDFADVAIPRLEIIDPPVLVPSSISVEKKISRDIPIKIGFFGHYRKGEKKLDNIIQAFIDANAQQVAKLIVQVAPTTEADVQEIEQTIQAFASRTDIEFIPRKLTSDEWYLALKKVDVLLLPYTNARYLYNWSAVYFNAIGLYKAVLTTKYLNPEVLARFKIGRELSLDSHQLLTQQLKEFLNGFTTQCPEYEQQLREANIAFSRENFLKKVLKNINLHVIE